MEWTFGSLLWWMLAFFFWFAIIWMFVGVFADIIRRDMSGWAKAAWILLIVCLPFLGILIYLIARPRTAGGAELGGWAPAPRELGSYRAADEIAKAAELRDQGKISADEFDYLKLRALNQ